MNTSISPPQITWKCSDDYMVLIGAATRWQTFLNSIKQDWQLAGEIARGERTGWPD